MQETATNVEVTTAEIAGHEHSTTATDKEPDNNNTNNKKLSKDMNKKERAAMTFHFSNQSLYEFLYSTGDYSANIPFLGLQVPTDYIDKDPFEALTPKGKLSVASALFHIKRVQEGGLPAEHPSLLHDKMEEETKVDFKKFLEECASMDNANDYWGDAINLLNMGDSAYAQRDDVIDHAEYAEASLLQTKIPALLFYPQCNDNNVLRFVPGLKERKKSQIFSMNDMKNCADIQFICHQTSDQSYQAASWNSSINFTTEISSCNDQVHALLDEIKQHTTMNDRLHCAKRLQKKFAHHENCNGNDDDDKEEDMESDKTIHCNEDKSDVEKLVRQVVRAKEKETKDDKEKKDQTKKKKEDEPKKKKDPSDKPSSQNNKEKEKEIENTLREIYFLYLLFSNNCIKVGNHHHYNRTNFFNNRSRFV